MKQTWNQAVATANKQHEAEIITAMNNIYWMAKTNQPISLFLSVNELLEHHGLDVFLDVICQEGLATYRECIG
jgi:hypothetical protein